jgi:hypothetical protein
MGVSMSVTGAAVEELLADAASVVDDVDDPPVDAAPAVDDVDDPAADAALVVDEVDDPHADEATHRRPPRAAESSAWLADTAHSSTRSMRLT